MSPSSCSWGSCCPYRTGATDASNSRFNRQFVEGLAKALERSLRQVAAAPQPLARLLQERLQLSQDAVPQSGGATMRPTKHAKDRETNAQESPVGCEALRDLHRFCHELLGVARHDFKAAE